MEWIKTSELPPEEHIEVIVYKDGWCFGSRRSGDVLEESWICMCLPDGQRHAFPDFWTPLSVPDKYEFRGK